VPCCSQDAAAYRLIIFEKSSSAQQMDVDMSGSQFCCGEEERGFHCGGMIGAGEGRMGCQSFARTPHKREENATKK
jgi:hypothetical protein